MSQLFNRFLLLFTLVILATITSCTSEPKSTVIANVDLEWILGDWTRIDEVEGKVTHEFWNKVGGDYVGFAYTLRDVDTVFKEEMKIFKLNNGWTLEVRGPNEEPTLFSIIEAKPTMFTANCPTNEFPKDITYYKEGENLHAVISDSTMSIPFEFSPM